MKASLLFHQRVVTAENKFAELVLWSLPKPLAGSRHSFKYRLAYVVNGECVLRYDNEAGEGDHRHFGGEERGYTFTDSEKLAADLQNDIERWNREDRDT